MNNMLKIIAVATMLCDHVGLIFFPDLIVFRIIGRLSLPIFCYFISQGYKHTKNLDKYTVTLFLFAIVSQISFEIMHRNDLNILFVFVIALLILRLKDSIGRIAYVFILTALILNTEYGLYPLILIIIFHEFEKERLLSLILISAATLGYSVSIGSMHQLVAIYAVIFIWYVKDIKLKINKYVFYAIYPVQWYVLIFVYLILK